MYQDLGRVGIPEKARMEQQAFNGDCCVCSTFLLTMFLYAFKGSLIAHAWACLAQLIAAGWVAL